MSTPAFFIYCIHICVCKINTIPLPYITLHRIAVPCITVYTMMGQNVGGCCWMGSRAYYSNQKKIQRCFRDGKDDVFHIFSRFPICHFLLVLLYIYTVVLCVYYIYICTRIHIYICIYEYTHLYITAYVTINQNDVFRSTRVQPGPQTTTHRRPYRLAPRVMTTNMRYGHSAPGVSLGYGK